MDDFIYFWEELQSPSDKVMYQHDYLFLIKHKDLYNGKLNKKQMINYIKKNFILGFEFDKIHMTHLMCACIYSQNDSNLELVKLLLNGSNIRKFGGANRSALVKLLLNDSNICKFDNTNRSALSYTLKNPGNIQILKFLITNIKSIDSHLINELFIYWSKTDYLPDINIAGILINAGASVNYKNSDDSTVLINIINNRNYGNISHIINFLLNNGVDINMKTKVKPYDDIIKNIRWVNKINLFKIDSIYYDETNDEPEYDLIDHAIERYNRDKNMKNYFCVAQFFIKFKKKNE